MNAFVAWNDVKNWVYIVAIVEDKHPQTDIRTYNRSLEIAIGPDIGEGDYYSRRFENFFNMIKVCLTPSEEENKGTFIINSGPEWLKKKLLLSNGDIQ